MLRGELSNEPSPTVLLDYKILVDQKQPLVWFMRVIPQLLLSKSFEQTMLELLPLKEGAAEWLQRNHHVNKEVFSIGALWLTPWIDRVLRDHVRVTRHFEHFNDLRFWLLTNTQVTKTFVSDQSQQDLQNQFHFFTGWTERA